MCDKNLLIPIYLNQKIIFDMIAIIEDGFSKLVSIKSSNETAETDTNILDVNAGLDSKLSFLKIKFSGKIDENRKQNKSDEKTVQKTHTPTSLFQKFLNYLNDNDMMVDLNDSKSYKVGDFVKLSGELIDNPIISTLESFIRLLSLIEAITPKNKKKGEYLEIRKQIDALLKAMQSNNKVDLICNISCNDKLRNAVIPVDLNCFEKNSIYDAVDGNFTIVGKIIKIVESDDSINLLRNTSFSKLNKEVLNKLFDSFSGDDFKKSGMDIIDFKPEIEGPSVMILPIAIFI